MKRASRTFKLRLSPAGMDLLIEAHCHLIHSTRALVAWGTTLHVALSHLDTIPACKITERLRSLPDAKLSGREEHCLGAPTKMLDIATRIARRVHECLPDERSPTLLSIYLVALQSLSAAESSALKQAYERVSA